MARNKITNHLFQKIGDSYGHFFDADHFLGRSAFEDNWMTKTSSNLEHYNDGYEWNVALPGFKKEEISIEVEDNMLHVIAEKDPGDQIKNKDFLLCEFDTERQERFFPLPKHADLDRFEARYENGLLKIKIPLHKEGTREVYK